MKVRIFKCLDKKRMVAGASIVEIVVASIGGFIGMALYGSIGGVLGMVTGFFMAKVFIKKDKGGNLKRQIYQYFPHIGNYGYLRRLSNKYYL